MDAGGFGEGGAGAAGEVDEDGDLPAEGAVQDGDGLVDGGEDGDGVASAADRDADACGALPSDEVVSTRALMTSRTPSSSWSTTSRTRATLTVTWSSPERSRTATDVPPPPRVNTHTNARTITTAHAATMIHSDDAGTLSRFGSVA